MPGYEASPALFHALFVGPGFGLFRRLVAGRTTFAAQLRRPAATRALRGLTKINAPFNGPNPRSNRLSP